MSKNNHGEVLWIFGTAMFGLMGMMLFVLIKAPIFGFSFLMVAGLCTFMYYRGGTIDSGDLSDKKIRSLLAIIAIISVSGGFLSWSYELVPAMTTNCIDDGGTPIYRDDKFSRCKMPLPVYTDHDGRIIP